MRGAPVAVGHGHVLGILSTHLHSIEVPAKPAPRKLGLDARVAVINQPPVSHEEWLAGIRLLDRRRVRDLLDDSLSGQIAGPVLAFPVPESRRSGRGRNFRSNRRQPGTSALVEAGHATRCITPPSGGMPAPLLSLPFHRLM